VNGLVVSATGEVIISVHGFDAIVAVDGDPASPAFLQMLWHAAGAPGGGADLPAPDYQPLGGKIFEAQHNASRHGDDLWVFDNGSTGSARALRMVMDHAAGSLVEGESWSVHQTCMNQGGAVKIDGGVLATCANSADVYAFREGAAMPEWTLNASCDGGGGPWGGGVSTRAFPVIVE
jgi:hypothetical protein